MIQWLSNKPVEAAPWLQWEDEVLREPDCRETNFECTAPARTIVIHCCIHNINTFDAKKDRINEKLCSDEDTFPVFCIFFVFSVCHYGILKSDTTLCRCGENITRRKSLNFHDFFHLTVGQSIIACLQRRKGHQGCRNDSGRKRDWCRRWKV